MPLELNIGLTALLAVLSLAFSVGQLLRYFDRRRRSLPLPPGPKGVPLFGNAFQIPLEQPWRVYQEWAKQYGDLTYLEAMGQPIVIVNSAAAANEILNKRAANYSDRAPSSVVDITEADWSFVLARYGRKWRDARRAFHQFYTQSYIPNFHPILEEEVVVLLRDLATKPREFKESTLSLFGTAILRGSYGVNDMEYNRKLAEDVELFNHDFCEYASPGRLLVGSFPWLRFVPDWFPGTQWKQALYGIRDAGHRAINKPFTDAQVRSLEGGHDERYPNIAQHLIASLPDENSPDYEYQRILARDVSGTSYTAGSHTTYSSAQALYIALAIHPEVQKKAQAEVDEITGGERLPTCADTKKMPYLQAIVKEVGRWHTVVPMALPHMCQEDDVYNGQLIPAGAWILPNSWAIMHDPEIFNDPMTFNPDRYYLKDQSKNLPEVLDPEVAAFGYGRRKCPGRHFSHDALSLMAASLMAVFDVKLLVDEAGKPVPIELKTTSSIVWYVTYSQRLRWYLDSAYEPLLPRSLVQSPPSV